MYVHGHGNKREYNKWKSKFKWTMQKYSDSKQTFLCFFDLSNIQHFFYVEA